MKVCGVAMAMPQKKVKIGGRGRRLQLRCRGRWAGDGYVQSPSPSGKTPNAVERASAEARAMDAFPGAYEGDLRIGGRGLAMYLTARRLLHR